MNKATIYLSGPINSRPDHNTDIFYRYEKIFIKRNYKVINPVRLVKDGNETKQEPPGHNELLAYNLAQLVGMADALVVLPGWIFSQVSRLEVAVALSLGIPVYCGTDPNALNLGVDINFYDKDVITEYGQAESFTETVKKLIDKMNLIDREMSK